MTEGRTWPRLLDKLVGAEDLSAEDTSWAMNQIMSGAATAAQIAGFAVALRAKGETPAEISGIAEGMLAHADRVSVPKPAIDIVGTGGDRSGSVNISTMAAIVTAAAGVRVVKHGNRASSSKSGTADVLEALGVTLGLPAAGVEKCVDEVGIGFCFAPVFHPAFRHTGPPRRELGIPTSFNLLGPLTNPGQPSAGLIGCAYADKTDLLASVFAGRGQTVLLVRGDDGLDELTTTTTSSAWVIAKGAVARHTIDPRVLDIPAASAADLLGGDAEYNAVVVRELLDGKRGPVRDAVLLNAGAAIAAFEASLADGFPEDLMAAIDAGITRARAAIDDGSAAALLPRWAALTTRLTG